MKLNKCKNYRKIRNQIDFDTFWKISDNIYIQIITQIDLNTYLEIHYKINNLDNLTKRDLYGTKQH